MPRQCALKPPEADRQSLQVLRSQRRAIVKALRRSLSQTFGVRFGLAAGLRKFLCRGSSHRSPMSFPMSTMVAIAATHVSLYIVRRSPAGPCRLEKTLSPAISSGRRRPAPMHIAAGLAIGRRCPIDHDRQRALFFQSFFFEFSAVPSMPQGFQQFPTTGDDIEEPSCSRPRPRAALSASIAGLNPMPFPMSITVAIAATHVSYI